MQIKIQTEIAFSDGTVEQAARRLAKDFGVLVELTGITAGGGWPQANIIGTPKAIIKMLTSEGGFSTGDEDDDAESVFYHMQSATEIYGG